MNKTLGKYFIVYRGFLFHGNKDNPRASKVGGSINEKCLFCKEDINEYLSIAKKFFKKTTAPEYINQEGLNSSVKLYKINEVTNINLKL